MYDLDFQQKEDYPITRSHEGILRLIEEIKDFEERFPEYYIGENHQIEDELIDVQKESSEITEFIETGDNTVEFIEVDSSIVEFVDLDSEPLDFEKTIDKPGLDEKSQKKGLFGIKIRSKSEAEIARLEKKVATFKLRFDQDGQLVNLDLKKSKPSKNKSDSNKKSKFKLPLPKRKGKSNEKEPEAKEEKNKSKKSKLKGGLGKLGGLKRAIPSRGKKEENKEESKSEE